MWNSADHQGVTAGGVVPVFRLCISPGEIISRRPFQFPGIFEQPGEIVQRVYPGQLAGMDQAHEQIPHLGPTMGFVEQGVFPVQDGKFENLFAQVVVQRAAGRLV